MSLGKVLLRVALALGALLVLLFLVTVVYLDPLATRAANAWLSGAFAVPASVDKVRIHLLAGTVTAEGLRISNPPGFRHPDFLALRKGVLSVRLGPGMKEIVAEKVRTEGLEIRIERSDSRDNAKEVFAGKPRKGSAGKRDGGEKRFRIRKAVLENTRVSFPASGGEKDVLLERVEIDEPLGKGTGALLGEVVAQVAARAVREAAGDAAGRALAAPMKAFGEGARRIGGAGKSAADSVGDLIRNLGR